MDNYKNKILQLINSNAILDENIYKYIYTTLLTNIRENEIILENNIIKKYDDMQIFYNKHSKIFIMCYIDKDIDFLIFNEDELMYDISKQIDNNIFSTDKKHSIISKIIYSKKKEKIKYFIPESKTIQNVIDILNTILYNHKDLCKYVLILIGELIEKKNNSDNIYLVNNDFKNFLIYIFDYGYSYFKTDNVNIENFKTKYYNYNLNNCFVIPCNRYKSFYNELIKKNIIEIILVSIYYKNRYKTSDNFIENNVSDEIKNKVCYLKKNTISNIIELFDKEYLEKSTCLKINHTELHYLWKEYCIHKQITNVVSFNQLKEYYCDDKLYRTSNKLEYVSELIEFWKQNMSFDKDETKFEISELQQLLKHKKGIILNEKKIISLISHFYHVDIENDKYINNINCKCFYKKEILNEFKKSEYFNNKITKNSLYKKYIEWENNKTKSDNIDIVISKNYFVEYI